MEIVVFPFLGRSLQSLEAGENTQDFGPQQLEVRPPFEVRLTQLLGGSTTSSISAKRSLCESLCNGSSAWQYQSLQCDSLPPVNRTLHLNTFCYATTTRRSSQSLAAPFSTVLAPKIQRAYPRVTRTTTETATRSSGSWHQGREEPRCDSRGQNLLAAAAAADSHIVQ